MGLENPVGDPQSKGGADLGEDGEGEEEEGGHDSDYTVWTVQLASRCPRAPPGAGARGTHKDM
jgi:hypothetical protein